MVVKKKFAVLMIISAILLIGVISASFNRGTPNHLIEKIYGPEDSIIGWVNLSLNKELGDSVLESSCEDVKGSIKLLDLIEKNSNANFVHTCDTIECVSNYADEDEKPSKNFTLDKDGAVLFGFKITDPKLITDISKFSLNVDSNASESEKLPLSINILDDKDEEWQAYKASDKLGSDITGCYFGTADGQKIISTDNYCEKIRIPQSPGVNLSAMVTGSGQVNFTFSIQNADGTEFKSCTTNTTATNQVGCSPDFQIRNSSDYFVCIKAKTSKDAEKNYKINYETNNPCGFVGNFDNNYDYDFQIFVEPKKYSELGKFTLDNAELKSSKSETDDIENKIYDYLGKRYNYNCSKSCTIPIKFTAGIAQEINISEAVLTYKSIATESLDGLYNLTETSAKITTTKFQKLYLDEANFKVPKDYDNYTCTFELNNNDLFTEKISVEKSVPSIQYLRPLRTAIKYPTKFVIGINSTGNISKYKWDFGNGDIKTTTTNILTYTYNESGEYNVKITATNIKNMSSSRTYKVTVSLASEAVPELMLEAEINIGSINEQVKSFSAFEQKGLNLSLNLSSLNSKMTALKNLQSKASSEADYEAILTELIDINVPMMVATMVTSNPLVFYPEANNINLAVLKEIGGGNYTAGKDEKYAEAVLGWEEKNTNTTIIYNEIASIYEDYEIPILKVFEIKVIKKAGAGNPYLIIKKMNNMVFEGSAPPEKSGYYYIDLTASEKTAKFFTTDDVDFINLPAFVSPKISELSLSDATWSPYDEHGELKKWILFSIIILALLVFGAIVWIILQLWYKRKYEDHLFKNKNNLYNLVNYIEQAKQRGMEEKDIVAKLRKAGWTNEQLRYAMRKYAGRRTGMVELPVGKLFEKDNSTKNMGS